MSKTLKDVALSGTVVYLVNQLGSLEAVNVSNPSAPQWMGGVFLSGFGSHLAVEGTQAVVISHTSTSDLLDIVDISIPSAMVRTGSAVIGTSGTGKGVALSNDLAYVAANSEGLNIYNIPASGNPVFHSQLYTVGNAVDIALNGSTAYVADSPAIIDVISLF